MIEKRIRPLRRTTLHRGDMVAMWRVVRKFHERKAMKVFCSYIEAIIPEFPDPDDGLPEVDVRITGSAGKCQIDVGGGEIQENHGGFLVIDNQTDDSICFDPGETGLFDQHTASVGVVFNEDGTICLPSGKSILTISDDAPDGEYELDFGCFKNGGGPRLIIPPPKV